jgi:hypothetical protein
MSSAGLLISLTVNVDIGVGVSVGIKVAVGRGVSVGAGTDVFVGEGVIVGSGVDVAGVPHAERTNAITTTVKKIFFIFSSFHVCIRDSQFCKERPNVQITGGCKPSGGLAGYVFNNSLNLGVQYPQRTTL